MLKFQNQTQLKYLFPYTYIWRSWQRSEVHAVHWSLQCKFHIPQHGFPALLYPIPDQNVQNSSAVSALSLTKGSLYASDILGWITSLKMIYYFQTALLRIEPNISEWGCPSSSASWRKRNTFCCHSQSRFPSTVVWHFVLLSSKQIMLLLDEVWSQLIEKQESFGERGVTFFWGHYGWALLYHCTVNKIILHWIIWLIQHI